MRDYEIVYIFRSSFTPEEIDAKLERYHSLIAGEDRGEITALEQWGKRQLAYPIRNESNGYYVVAQFTADPAVLPDLERALKLEEDLLRYLIVLSEGELPVPASLQVDDDEDEDDEDEDEDDEERPRKRAARVEEEGDDEEGEEEGEGEGGVEEEEDAEGDDEPADEKED